MENNYADNNPFDIRKIPQGYFDYTNNQNQLPNLFQKEHISTPSFVEVLIQYSTFDTDTHNKSVEAIAINHLYAHNDADLNSNILNGLNNNGYYFIDSKILNIIPDDGNINNLISCIICVLNAKFTKVIINNSTIMKNKIKDIILNEHNASNAQTFFSDEDVIDAMNYVLSLSGKTIDDYTDYNRTSTTKNIDDALKKIITYDDNVAEFCIEALLVNGEKKCISGTKASIREDWNNVVKEYYSKNYEEGNMDGRIINDFIVTKSNKDLESINIAIQKIKEIHKEVSSNHNIRYSNTAKNKATDQIILESMFSTFNNLIPGMNLSRVYCNYKTGSWHVSRYGDNFEFNNMGYTQVE